MKKTMSDLRGTSSFEEWHNHWEGWDMWFTGYSSDWNGSRRTGSFHSKRSTSSHRSLSGLSNKSKKKKTKSKNRHQDHKPHDQAAQPSTSADEEKSRVSNRTVASDNVTSSTTSTVRRVVKVVNKKDKVSPMARAMRRGSKQPKDVKDQENKNGMSSSATAMMTTTTTTGDINDKRSVAKSSASVDTVKRNSATTTTSDTNDKLSVAKSSTSTESIKRGSLGQRSLQEYSQSLLDGKFFGTKPQDKKLEEPKMPKDSEQTKESLKVIAAVDDASLQQPRKVGGLTVDAPSAAASAVSTAFTTIPTKIGQNGGRRPMSSIICGVYGKLLGDSSSDDDNSGTEDDDEEREDTGLVPSPRGSKSERSNEIETPSADGVTTKKRWWAHVRHKNNKNGHDISTSRNPRPKSSRRQKKADWRVAPRHASDTDQALFLVRSPKSRSESKSLRQSTDSASLSTGLRPSLRHLLLSDHRQGDSIASSISCSSADSQSVESWVWDDGNETFFYEEDDEEAFVPNSSTAMMIF